MIADAINLFNQVFFNGTFAGSSWIMYMTILVGSLAMISRNWQDWATLTLPVMIGWKYFGMPIPITFLVIGSIMFVIDILSFKVIAGSLAVVGEKIQDWGMKGRIGRELHRINIKDAMNSERVKVAEGRRKIGKEKIEDTMILENKKYKEIKDMEEKVYKENMKERMKEKLREEIKSKKKLIKEKEQ